VHYCNDHVACPVHNCFTGPTEVDARFFAEVPEGEAVRFLRRLVELPKAKRGRARSSDSNAHAAAEARRPE